MWRRFGDVAYALLVLVVITLEAVPLALLTWTFVQRSAGVVPASRPGAVLLSAVSSAALGVILISGYILGYHGMSARRERAVRERLDAWTARWMDVLVGRAKPPAGRLPREAAFALLDLREVVRGDEAAHIQALAERYGLVQALLHRLSSHRLSVRLEALEGLAQGRFAAAFDAVAAHITDPDPAVRLAATRAAARTLAAIPSGLEREGAAGTLARLLEASGLPIGVIEEALLLLEDAAPAVLLRLIVRPEAAPASVKAALDAVGRLKLLTFGEEVARFVDDPDAEVRAAALRALARLGYIPQEAEAGVVAALADDVEFVRIHGTRAAPLLPEGAALPALREAAGDSSWWVRRAAAESLAAMREPGVSELRKVAAEHPDRFAREMAEQVLRDAGLLPAGVDRRKR